MASERNNLEDKPDRASEPNNELLGLAQQFDRGASPNPSNEHLDADDRQELDRVQAALGILNAVKTDFEFLEHQAAHDTLATSDTLNDKVKTKTPALPSQIGRFSIQGLLGQGGYAKVFLAYDPNLNRKVAVKVLKASQIFSSDSLARFEREAKAAAVLSHPNIIPVFETGTIESDQFIVSEYCQGINLEEWLRQRNNQVEPKIAAVIVEAVADAVAHAHQRGILHRDLKLANLMLDQSEFDPQATMPADAFAERVRVTDFGLAKPMHGSDILETSEGAIVGTPAYMSPEQASGSPDITTSTDIYSLGVVLYQLLTGKLPIVGKSHIDTLIAVKRDEPLPLRRLNPNVPLDLQAICLKCLEKKPSARYPSAFELAEDLRNWSQGIPVNARHVTAVEKFGKWCKRNPALTTALIAMTAGLIGTIIQWRSAVVQNARADRHLEMSQRVIDQMANMVASDLTLPNELRLSMAQRAVDLQQSLFDEEPDDKVVALQTARAHKRLSRVQNELYQNQEALDALNQALAIVEPYQSEIEFQELFKAIHDARAGTLRRLNREDEAEQSVDEITQKSDAGSEDAANAHFQTGMLHLKKQDYESAIEQYSQAEEIYRASGPYSKFALSRTILFHGLAALSSNDFEIAKERTEEALELLLELKESDQGGSVRILQDIGRCRLHLAQISLAQLRQLELPVEPQLPLLHLCRQQFNEAADAFGDAVVADQTVVASYGMQAMVYEIFIKLETEQNSDDAGREPLIEFHQLYQTIDPSIPFRVIAGRILAESELRVAQALISRGDVEDGLAQLQGLQNFLNALMIEFPGVEKIEKINQECSALLGEQTD